MLSSAGFTLDIAPPLSKAELSMKAIVSIRPVPYETGQERQAAFEHGFKEISIANS